MARHTRSNSNVMKYQSSRIITHWLIILCAWILLPSLVVATTCNKPFSKVYNEVSPSVVRIFMVAIDPYSALQSVQLGVGTGVVFDNDGHIVTNTHLVYETKEIIVSIGEDDMQQAEIVGIDPITDLAVIRLKALASEPLAFSQSTKP